MNHSIRIRHTVVFKLIHPRGSVQESAFLAAAEGLKGITGVEKFEILKQISPKNDFDWGISMEFANSALYQQYNQHPNHSDFVEKHWLKEVEKFLEIDFEI